MYNDEQSSKPKNKFILFQKLKLRALFDSINIWIIKLNLGFDCFISNNIHIVLYYVHTFSYHENQMGKLKIKCHTFWGSNYSASVPVTCIYWIPLLGHLIHINQWLIVGTHIVAHMVHTNYFLNQKLCLKVMIIVKKN